MIIRKGTIQDLESVLQLGQTGWKQYEQHLSLENWKAMSASLSDASLYRNLLLNSTSFLCEDQYGRVVGMSYLVPSGNPTEIYNSEQCYIRFVTVSEACSGLKLGQKLCEQCIEFARGAGEKKIALHTAEFMVKARHIYEKMGFEVVREIAPRYGKKYWLYEMSL